MFAGLPSEAPQIQLDANLIHYKELIITGTTANTTTDCREALDLVRTGQIDITRLISARYPLTAAGDALQAAGSGKVLKVVLEP